MNVQAPNHDMLPTGQNLQQSVVHRTFDELANDLEGASIEEFLDQTIKMTRADEEAWRETYDALDRIRVLNKFYVDVLEANLDKFDAFIDVQIDNLRSSNSRNALQCYYEIMNNQEPKTAGQWKIFVQCCLNTVLKKCIHDKQFIANIAKRGVTATAENALFNETVDILVQSCQSKALSLSEFALSAVFSFVQRVGNEFYLDNKYADKLVKEMCLQIEGKKARMVKHATSALKRVQETLSQKVLEDLMVKSLSQVDEDAEEHKEEPDSLAQIQARVKRILESMEPKKKIDKSKDFRSFMKTQKNDLKEMVLDETPVVVASSTLTKETASQMAIDKPDAEMK